MPREESGPLLAQAWPWQARPGYCTEQYSIILYVSSSRVRGNTKIRNHFSGPKNHSTEATISPFHTDGETCSTLELSQGATGSLTPHQKRVRIVTFHSRCSGDAIIVAYAAKYSATHAPLAQLQPPMATWCACATLVVSSHRLCRIQLVLMWINRAPESEQCLLSPQRAPLI
jgi:hypothetical protein